LAECCRCPVAEARGRRAHRSPAAHDPELSAAIRLGLAAMERSADGGADSRLKRRAHGAWELARRLWRALAFEPKVRRFLIFILRSSQCCDARPGPIPPAFPLAPFPPCMDSLFGAHCTLIQPIFWLRPVAKHFNSNSRLPGCVKAAEGMENVTRSPA